MARNFVQPGWILTLTAPYDLTSGQGALVGSIFGVATGAALFLAPVELQIDGVWDLEKRPDQEWFPGDRVYWDDQNRRCDRINTGHVLIGTAPAAAANPSTTGIVRLNAAASSELEAETAIPNLDGGDLLADVIAKVNTILQTLRNQEIIGQ